MIRQYLQKISTSLFYLFALMLLAACNSNDVKPEKIESPKIQKSSATKANGVADKNADKSTDKKIPWDLPPSFKQKKPIKTLEVASVKPNLSGVWSLNKDLSDDPKEKLKQAMASGMGDREAGGRGMGGRGGGKGGGKGGGRGGGKGGGKAGEKNGRMGRPGSAFTMAKTLNLKHTEPLLIITDDNQHKQRVYTDFRSQSVSANGSLDQKVVTASWEGDILIVETTTDNNPRTEQHYQLIPEFNQLSITTKMTPKRSDKKVSIYLIYDRVKE